MEMRFSKVKPKLEKLIVFNLHDLYLIDPSFRQSSLYDWLRHGWVTKLRRNRYVLSDFKPWGYDFYLLSNRSYQPSYISLELALNHYGIIPESVPLVTAVSTLKTQSFTNSFGTFQYQSIAEPLFFGYENILHRERNIQIATLEKAVLDYLYFNSRICTFHDFVGLRWNQEYLAERVNWEKLRSYLAVFNNMALSNRVSVLENYVKGSND